MLEFMMVLFSLVASLVALTISIKNERDLKRLITEMEKYAGQ